MPHKRAHAPFTAAEMMQSPLYETYAQVAPRVQDWPLLISRLEELLAATMTGRPG